MADISGSISKLNTDEVDQNKPVSQSLFSKIGANINELIDRLINISEVISSSSGTFSYRGVSYTDVTNLSVTITTEGRPVYLSLVADGSSSPGILQYTIDQYAFIAFARDGSRISIQRLDGLKTVPPSCVSHVDTPSAGTYTYKVQVSNFTAVFGDMKVERCKLIAVEF